MEPIINLEDPVVKTYGKRLPPNPLTLEGSRKRDMIAWQKVFPANYPPKGVYRFKTHEEADAWMLKMLARKSH